MKKFLVFSVICLVTACLGLMTYRFLTLEETISVNQTIFEVNIGDQIPLEITRNNPKPNNDPIQESLNKEVVDYDPVLNAFYAIGGGKAVLRITSPSSMKAPILITVTVGNGTETSPFIIKTAADFAKIGVPDEEDPTVIRRGMDKYYTIVNDLDFSTVNDGEWKALGDLEHPFTGTIYCNNHTFVGLKMSDNTVEGSEDPVEGSEDPVEKSIIKRDGEPQASEILIAGLFAKIGVNEETGKQGLITGGLTISSPDIQGSFDYAGIICGQNEGKIENVKIENEYLTSTKINAFVGSIAGLNNGNIDKCNIIKGSVYATSEGSVVGGLIGKIDNTGIARAIVSRSYCEGVNVKGYDYVGGLVGYIEGGVLADCYSAKIDLEEDKVDGVISTISTSTESCVGGLVGEVSYKKVEKEGKAIKGIIGIVMDCYSTSKIDAETSNRKGQLIGYSEEFNNNTKNRFEGLYYDRTEGLLGIGENTFGKVVSRDNEIERFEYIYDNLWEESISTNENKFKSHYEINSISSSEPVLYYWASNMERDNGVIWTYPGDAYPLLNMNSGYYDYSNKINSNTDRTKITTANDFKRIKQDIANGDVLDYTIVYDEKLNGGIIDLRDLNEEWTPIGIDKPFMGTITCETDENGKPLVEIRGLEINQSNGGYAEEGGLYSGLFGIVGYSAKISNIKLVDVNIEKGQMVGAIAGINHGTITDCTVITSEEKKITTNNIGGTVGTENDNNLYIGGLVGFNDGSILNSTLSGYYIGCENGTNDTLLSLGGIAGYNGGLIQYCRVVPNSGLSVIKTNVKTQSFIGGIAGNNQSMILSCGFSMSISVSYDCNKSYIGGIAGLNDTKGTIKYSYSDGMIDGTNIGGIAGISSNIIDQCYSKNTFTGRSVAGIVNQVNSGEVSNCYSGAFLMGVGEDSVKAGMVINVALDTSAVKGAKLSNCFSYCSFDGTGKNYYDTACDARKDTQQIILSKITRDKGYLINCIFDREAGSDAERSNYKLAFWDVVDWRDPDTIVAQYNEEQSYKYDCGMTTEECKSEAGARVFRTYKFDTSIWDFNDGQYPTLINVLPR